MDAKELLERYQKGERDFSGLDLKGIDLQGANIAGISFEGTDLRQACLQSTNLSNASLCKANLSKSNLTSAILTGADLTEAKLHQTDLTKVDLRNTVLLNAEIKDSVLEEAVHHEGNKLPSSKTNIPSKSIRREVISTFRALGIALGVMGIIFTVDLLSHKKMPFSSLYCQESLTEIISSLDASTCIEEDIWRLRGSISLLLLASGGVFFILSSIHQDKKQKPSEAISMTERKAANSQNLNALRTNNVQQSSTIVNELKNLSDLRDKGVITQDEFEHLKKQLLNPSQSEK